MRLPCLSPVPAQIAPMMAPLGELPRPSASPVANPVPEPGLFTSSSSLIQAFRRAGLNEDAMARAINRTAHTANLSDIRLARKVVSVALTELDARARPWEARERQRRLNEVLEPFLRGEVTLNEDSLAYLLDRLATPQSHSLLDEWSCGLLRIRFVSGKDFDARIRRWGQEAQGCSTLFYDLLPSPPEILIRRMLPLEHIASTPRRAVYHDLRERLQGVFHEWEHFRHFNGHYEGLEAGGSPVRIGVWSRKGRYVSEIMAYLEEYRAAVQILDERDAQNADRQKIPLALYYRNRVYQDYFAWRWTERWWGRRP